MREVEVPELEVLCVDGTKPVAAADDKIMCTVCIEAPKGNSHTLQLIVDTGASVSILRETMYKQYFADCSLCEPKVRLVTYAKSDLPVLGCLHATASIADNSKRVPTKFYIVKTGSPLLGLDLIKALNVSIIGGIGGECCSATL